MIPRPSIPDSRDHAAFFLNLSRLGGEVASYRVEGRPAYLVNSPELAEEVLARHEARSFNPPHPYRDLGPHYRPAGAAMLRLRHETSARRDVLGRLMAGRESVPARWLSRLASDHAGAPVDVDFQLKRLLLCLISDTLFGVDVEPMSAEFVAGTNFLEECQANRAHGRAAPEAVAWAVAAQEGLAGWIAHQRRMIAGPPEAAGAGEVVNAIVRTLLNGYNATATALSWMLHLLAAHPEVQASLRRKLVPQMERGVEAVLLVREGRQVVMESLRLYPPAWILGREALEDQVLGGTRVERGAIISVSPYTMQRHPKLWDAPAEFRPERFAPGAPRPNHRFAYFPFGGGQRSCPAARPVTAQLQVLLAVALATLELSPADPRVPPKPRGLISLRPDPGVFLRLRPAPN